MLDFDRTKAKLDSISPSLCLAKWTQVTIHLGTGLTHSCHHPTAHKISDLEVSHNPKALHCTRYKKRCWKQMLKGERPAECDYCWKIEDNSKLHSDRIFKSTEPWAMDHLEEIVESSWLDDFNPTYVELSFSNRCNYKCIYCSPPFSSRWQAEAKKYGPVKLPGVEFDHPIDAVSEERCNHIELNPLVEAFWEWWPELFRSLHTFRMTGGEPLLVEECYQVLEYVQEHWQENPNLNLSLNTNLGMSDESFERFIEIAKDLSNGKVREFVLFTSIESLGAQAEYARFGLNEEKFWQRIERLLTELPKLTIGMMATFNILSISTYKDLVEKVYDLKKKYLSPERVYNTAIMLDTSFLRWPEMLSIKLATPEQVEQIRKFGERVEELKQTRPEWVNESGEECVGEWTAGFCQMEIEKAQRVYDYVINDQEPFDKEEKRKQLIALLEEMDRRRGTDYKVVFPELIS